MFDNSLSYNYIYFLGTPYWEIGAPMQHYISKSCATEQRCQETIAAYMPKCLRIWWKDWRCAECCKGDRCNYYITVSKIFFIHIELCFFHLFNLKFYLSHSFSIIKIC